MLKQINRITEEKLGFNNLKSNSSMKIPINTHKNHENSKITNPNYTNTKTKNTKKQKYKNTLRTTDYAIIF
jgi:hypothetical protein